MSNSIPIEDLPEDIISKAQRGLNLANTQLAELAGVSTAAIDSVLSGQFDEDVVHKIAPHLKLDAQRIIDLHTGAWFPKIQPVPYLKVFNSSFKDMTVNTYLLWDNFTSKAVLFDTGTEADVILDFLKDEGLELVAIMLTHTHPDHIAVLNQLQKTTEATIYTPKEEAMPDTQNVEEGLKFKLGKLNIHPLSTPGHSQGGTSYHITGLACPAVICGDAVFAGSVGGLKKQSYLEALAAIRTKLLSLPGHTLLCPGHGPMTSVKEETRHNPFFPA